MAQVGDVVCVTGYIGDSAGGLQILLNKLPHSEEHRYLIDRHHKPEPRIVEGRFLAGLSGVNAMMDISDGIASDLAHILKASGVSARIDISRLPLSTHLESISAKYGWSPIELATTGGEDYELLITVASDQFESIQNAFQSKFGMPLTKIGLIAAMPPEIAWHDGDKNVAQPKSGFNHFK